VTTPGPSPNRVPLIGLIGPIGSGKSTVAGWLAERGAAVNEALVVAEEAWLEMEEAAP
jgi:dephospho-CoA kinase